MSDAAARRSIDAVWRIESGRLIAGLVRMVRDVGLAEDLAQDALVAALTRAGAGAAAGAGGAHRRPLVVGTSGFTARQVRR